MKISKLVASLMLSTTLLSLATPVLADQIDQSSETTKSEKTSSSANIVDTSTKESSSTAESKNEPIQELKEQKMIIKKIIAKGGSQMATVSDNNKNTGESTPGIAESDYKGVPNSKFVVYDVTDLLETVIKEKLGVSDEKIQRALETASSEEKQEDKVTPMSSTQKAASELKNDTSKESGSATQESSKVEESDKKTAEDVPKKTKQDADRELVGKVKELRQGDMLRKTISERAAKLNKEQLKVVTEVTTDDQGQAEVILPIDGKYHAYYVVNTETDKESYATNASPIVVITPVTDTDGKYATEFTIYPKSDTIEKEQPAQETPQKETTATMYQTGHKEDASLFAKIKKWITDLF